MHCFKLWQKQQKLKCATKKWLSLPARRVRHARHYTCKCSMDAADIVQHRKVRLWLHALNGFFGLVQSIRCSTERRCHLPLKCKCGTKGGQRANCRRNDNNNIDIGAQCNDPIDIYTEYICMLACNNIIIVNSMHWAYIYQWRKSSNRHCDY